MGGSYVPPNRRPGRKADDSNNKRGRGAEANPVATLLKEAALLQNQGERQEGEKALRHLQGAVDKFRAVLSSEPAAEQRDDALIGLGDCLLKAAEETVGAAPTASTWAEEAALAASAASLCEQSAQAYEQVLGDDGATRDDALVNMGNALALWAEHCETRRDNPKAVELLDKATTCYHSALNKTPEDVDIITNLADATMQRAAIAHSVGDVHSSEQLYQQGIELYMRGCSYADSRMGDDLSGLVFNWGVGLYSMAQHVQAPEAALSLLAAAAAKLRESMALSKTDLRVFNALGDTFAAQGEAHLSAGQHAPAAAAFECALGADGYGGALRIVKNDVDATIGLAETHLSIARLMAAQEAQPGAYDGAARARGSAARFAQSAALYGGAFQLLAQEGPRWKFTDRCERVARRLIPDSGKGLTLNFTRDAWGAPQAAFNHSCACVGAGQCEAAFQILSQLVQCGGVGVGELTSDTDFTRVREQPWFHELVAVAASLPVSSQ